jgi:hypothetical protein
MGEPVDVSGAADLAASDSIGSMWAIGPVGPRPAEGKKGADQGIDGRICFHEDDGTTRQIILSVQSLEVARAVRSRSARVREREKAANGVLIALDEPTEGMRTEAASAALYKSPRGQHPEAPDHDRWRIALRHGRSTSLRTMRAAAIGGGVYWRMANSSKIDRAQHKAAAQRNRVNAVRARARKGAKKRRSARASNAAAVKTAPKTPPASS